MSASDQDAQHREKMKAVQAEHRAKMKEKKQAEGGLLLVYTGNGKGKSTSAFGTVIRALGWGHSVAVVQYIKGTWKTGEREFFTRFPDLLTWHAMGEGFTWDTQDRQRDRQAAEAAWAKSRAFLESGDYDLVLLDEINIALRYDQLPVEAVVEGVKARHPRTSVILTGRDAKPELLELADLVTEMQQVRHPFEQGIKAKQGIDY
jgi:cob(I)alamin adenosyltransferase